MRYIYVVFYLTITVLLSSCDFKLNDEPGAQISASIKEAKSHGTFICSYGVKGNKIDGIEIKSIFAEKKYWRGEGVFFKKKINCCESQLVIVSNDNEPFTTERAGFNKRWKINGFKNKYTLRLFKEYEGILFPDTIPIAIMAIKGQDCGKIIQRLTLYKIR